jgi:hypothetical protein
LRSAVESAKKLKSDIETRNIIIKSATVRSCEFDHEIALDGLEILREEKIANNAEIRNIFLKLYSHLVISNNAPTAYQILQKRPDSLEQFISSVKTLPIKTIVEDIAPIINESHIVSTLLRKSIGLIFRERKYIDNYLFDATSLAIRDPELLYNILYRYAAYIGFCSNEDMTERTKILKEINEVIAIDDWVAELKY